MSKFPYETTLFRLSREEEEFAPFPHPIPPLTGSVQQINQRSFQTFFHHSGYDLPRPPSLLVPDPNSNSQGFPHILELVKDERNIQLETAVEKSVVIYALCLDPCSQSSLRQK